MGRWLLAGRHREQGTDALCRIYDKYRDGLLVLAIALSHDVHMAEDAAHDVFMSFAQSFADREFQGNLRAYLSTCVANRVRDLMHKERGRARAAEPDTPEPADTQEPSRRIICNEELRLLSAALAELPEEQREVIVLHIHGQMRFTGIAKSPGVSVNTVKGRYRYGIRRLRSILNGAI
jgi:RNA polymerase sigma-70 factor (ECF subfamily)